MILCNFHLAPFVSPSGTAISTVNHAPGRACQPQLLDHTKIKHSREPGAESDYLRPAWLRGHRPQDQIHARNQLDRSQATLVLINRAGYGQHVTTLQI